MNRVGDMLLSIGFFAMIALFGSLDYATVFSLSPYINETYITIIGLLIFAGATAKSAQIPLHVWLPASMEGLKLKIFITILIYISLCNYNPEIFLNLHFYSDCGIDWLSTILPIILNSIPKNKLHIITGNMLGDGSISYTKNRKGEYSGQAKYSMTMDTYSLNYLNYLFLTVYGEYCNSGIYPYPNIKLPQHEGKIIKQYSFTTLSHPLFSELHSLWYKLNDKENKYIKIVPQHIEEMFSPISLAHWIMDDGYFDGYGRTKTTFLCTESFNKSDCVRLQSLLDKFNIKSTLKIRNKEANTFRIRISKTSMPLLRVLVKPYMHNDFLYKLGD